MIREFTYLDIEGIESLYVQTCGRVRSLLEETRQSKSKAAGKGKFKATLGQLLSFLNLPSGEVNVSGELAKEDMTSTKVQYSLAPENKLNIVIEALRLENTLKSSLEDGLRELLMTGDSAFVQFKDSFRLLGWKQSANVIALINSSQFVRFELARDCVVDDQSCYIQMVGSLFKWFRLRERKHCHLDFVTHMAQRIMGDQVHLSAFGNLSRSYDVFYVKPFAITV